MCTSNMICHVWKAKRKCQCEDLDGKAMAASGKLRRFKKPGVKTDSSMASAGAWKVAIEVTHLHRSSTLLPELVRSGVQVKSLRKLLDFHCVIST